MGDSVMSRVRGSSAPSSGGNMPAMPLPGVNLQGGFSVGGGVNTTGSGHVQLTGVMIIGTVILLFVAHKWGGLKV